MSITQKDVEYVARLARLALDEDEVAVVAEQLSKILDHAARVTGLDTEGVPPTAHAIPLSNVVREDEVRPSLSQEQALVNAPLEEAGHFRVPRIIE
ncbi:MAG: Asp-tRNA(Asn)/Glu-tRNA(Gln) amidotransferase subunit GatC [Actinomycetota bacterium]